MTTTSATSTTSTTAKTLPCVCICGTALVIPATGRTPRFCSKQCRQAAHRARQRVEHADQEAARQRARITRDAAEAAKLAAELAAAWKPLAAADPGPGHGEPMTGWEPAIVDLARRVASLAEGIRYAAKDHEGNASAYRTDTRLLG